MVIESKRKEVNLSGSVIERLQILADKKQWSLKKYMEWVLIKESSKSIKSNQSTK